MPNATKLIAWTSDHLMEGPLSIFFSWFLLLQTSTFSFYSFSLLISNSVSLLLFLRSDRARSQLHDTSPRVRKCFVDFTIWFDILFMKEIVRACHWIEYCRIKSKRIQSNIKQSKMINMEQDNSVQNSWEKYRIV